MFIVKKFVSLVFALPVIANPSLAWGWGEGGCPGYNTKRIKMLKLSK
tara:strand:- start:217 stop:357 length:141 start_codon:yes stop_codon:yes gene_type:complete